MSSSSPNDPIFVSHATASLSPERVSSSPPEATAADDEFRLDSHRDPTSTEFNETDMAKKEEKGSEEEEEDDDEETTSRPAFVPRLLSVKLGEVPETPPKADRHVTAAVVHLKRSDNDDDAGEEAATASGADDATAPDGSGEAKRVFKYKDVITVRQKSATALPIDEWDAPDRELPITEDEEQADFVMVEESVDENRGIFRQPSILKNSSTPTKLSVGHEEKEKKKRDDDDVGGQRSFSWWWWWWIVPAALVVAYSVPKLLK